MYSFLTLVALVASEIAIIALGFVWVFIPGIERYPTLYATWAVGSIPVTLAACFWVGHWIIGRGHFR